MAQGRTPFARAACGAPFVHGHRDVLHVGAMRGARDTRRQGREWAMARRGTPGGSLEQPAAPRRQLEEPAPLAWLADRPSYPWLVVGTVCIGAFMGQLDASIAQLVLPTLEQAFVVALSSVEWIALAYLLTLAALLAPVGRLADIAGRKLLYILGFLVFVVGSALCGAAPNLPFLLASRVLQAVGAAFLQANSVAIVTAAAGPKRRGKAIGIQGTAQAIGLSVGPALGGLLISTLGWRWVFFINVPAGILGIIAGWFVLPRTVGLRHERQPFDLAGALLLAVALVALLLVLSKGQTWGWLSSPIIVLAAVAVVSVAAFIWREGSTTSPVVDLTLFRSRAFSLGNVTGLLSYGVTFGIFLLIPFELERIYHDTPLQAGALLTAVPVALAIVAPISGTWSDRVGARPPTVSGMLVATLALVVLALTVSGGSTIILIVGLAALGVGLGLFTPSNNSSIMGSAPPTRLGVAGGVLNMMRSLGTSLGVALSGTVIAATLQVLGGPAATTLGASTAQFAEAMQVALVVLAGMALAACLLSLPRGDVRGAGHGVALIEG
jgi:EmrB/QacA subfamily drug resistance transporter